MNKVYQVITDRFIEALEKDLIPWEKPWSAGGLMPRNAVSGKTYSGVNIMMLAMEAFFKKFNSPFWVTYKQATQLGGSVTKGEKSTPVTYWGKLYFDAETDEKIPAKKAKKLLKDEANKDKIRISWMLRYYNVFNIEQCEDIDMDKVADIPGVETHEHEPDEVAQGIIDTYIQREGISTTEGAAAFYVPVSDSITMPPLKTFSEAEKYYSTFFHEMVHSTGHVTRLKRELSGNMKTQSYSKEELTAEIGASFLNHHVGFLETTIENSEAYIKGWLKRLKGDDGATYIIHAASRAEKAVDFIIGEAKQESKPQQKAELVTA